MVKTPTFSVKALKERINDRIKEVEGDRDEQVKVWLIEANALKAGALIEAKRQIKNFDPKAIAHVLITHGRSSGRIQDSLVHIQVPHAPYIDNHETELTHLRSKLNLLEMANGDGVELTGPFKDLENVISGRRRY